MVAQESGSGTGRSPPFQNCLAVQVSLSSIGSWDVSSSFSAENPLCHAGVRERFPDRSPLMMMSLSNCNLSVWEEGRERVRRAVRRRQEPEEMRGGRRQEAVVGTRLGSGTYGDRRLLEIASVSHWE